LKQAYVSVIFPFSGRMPSSQEITALDAALKLTTREHELIFITIFNSEVKNFEIDGLSGPLSVIYTNSISSQNSSGLQRLGAQLEISLLSGKEISRI